MHAAPPLLLAHGGGAPEALTVILPILIFAGFMYVERRNRRRDAEAPAAEDGIPPAASEDRPAAGPA